MRPRLRPGRRRWSLVLAAISPTIWPVGVLSGAAIQIDSPPPLITDAVLIGVDLGPNLSVTGSLATVLWLVALRREGEHVSALQFLNLAR